MSNESENLDERVGKWLAEEGYRVEYTVDKAFRDVGVKSVMSNYFQTPEGTWREIDVTASMQSQNTYVNPDIVRIMCECKYSKDKPWILMHSGLQSQQPTDWICTPKSPNLNDKFLDLESTAKYFSTSWHYLPKQFVAHNIVQAFRRKNKEKDMAFDALQKIANAAWDYATGPSQRGEHHVRIVCFPCLVIDGPLYWTWYDSEHGGFHLQKAQYGRISWTGARGGTMVDVVQLDHIYDYAMAIKGSLQTMLKALESL